MTFNRYSGWLIGTFLSVLPRRICFFFHYLAEKKAAKGYSELMDSIKNIDKPEWHSSSDIKTEVQKIIDNEILHSKIFKALMN